MNRFRFAVFTALFFIFVFSFNSGIQAQNRADRAIVAQAERVSGDRFDHFSQTRKGAHVYSVNRPSSQMLNAIDTGLSNLFAVARKNRYSRSLNYSDYTIFIAKADRTQDSQKRYSPDIAVGAAQYAGTDYDQGGYIYAAGMVIGYNPNAFLIAEHTKNLSRVSEVVRYEGEHLVLYHNDRRRYQQTADHSQGGGHPILQ
ncbi:hypothetical protein BH20ACI4_BH20ACI4_16360 [soil metagenome]